MTQASYSCCAKMLSMTDNTRNHSGDLEFPEAECYLHLLVPNPSTPNTFLRQLRNFPSCCVWLEWDPPIPLPLGNFQ